MAKFQRSAQDRAEKVETKQYFAPAGIFRKANVVIFLNDRDSRICLYFDQIITNMIAVLWQTFRDQHRKIRAETVKTKQYFAWETVNV